MTLCLWQNNGKRNSSKVVAQWNYRNQDLEARTYTKVEVNPNRNSAILATMVKLDVPREKSYPRPRTAGI